MQTTFRPGVDFQKHLHDFKKQLDIVSNSSTDTHEQAVFNLARLKGAGRVLVNSCLENDDLPGEIFTGHKSNDRPESDCGNWP